MNRFARGILTAALIAGGLAGRAGASFEEFLTGGRATALDGGVTAASDDIFSLYYNPSGTLQIRQPEIGTYYGELYRGLTDNSNLSRSFFGFVYPMKQQAFGVSYGALSLSDLYKEESVGLTYAHTLGARLNAGVTMKYLSKTVGRDPFTENAVDPLTGATFGEADPVFDKGHTARAISGDAGVQYRLTEGVTLGGTVLNINEPNVALGADQDPAPRTIKVGVAAKHKATLLTIDVSRARFTQEETRLHGGIETWIGKTFALRLGGVGARDYLRFTTGLSFRLGLFQFDYGFMMPFTSVQGTSGTHQASLIFRFGPTVSERAELSRALPPVDALVRRIAYHSAPTSLAVPEKVRPLEMILVSDHAITTTWSSARGVRQYNLIATVSPTYPTKLVSASRATDIAMATASGLAPRTTYYLFVNACNEAGCSGFTSVGAATTLPRKPASAVLFTLHLNAQRAFDEGDLVSDDRAKLEIEELVWYLRRTPDARVELRGHTDNTGVEVDNVKSSHEFTHHLADVLVRRFSLAPDRLTYRGYGSSDPLEDNATEEGKEKNRRVEAVVTFDEMPRPSSFSLQTRGPTSDPFTPPTR